jgi:hypothetical protein
VLALVGGEDLDAPAHPLRVAAVHAEQVAGEDRRLVAAGAGADLQEDVGLVQRVARHEVLLEHELERLDALRGQLDLLLGQAAQLGSASPAISSAAARSARALCQAW